jgi:hypothetical protein
VLIGASPPIWGPNEVPVYTAKGTRIPNERPPAKPPGAMKESRRLVEDSQYASAELRSLGSTYNCAGLVLASRRTWIDDLPNLLVYLAEDGYRPLKASEKTWPGDVVVYFSNERKPEHVGVVVRVPTESLDAIGGPVIMSKWGFFGEYIHRVMDKPAYLGTSYEVWTERL